ncbi:hypothetical protein [Flavobacterium sp.]|uniref:hypothetical protein n=1 Tax=Flavobacterium sp. TaxID=239 RepID=UPI003A93BEA9
MNNEEMIFIAVPKDYPEDLYGFMERDLNSLNFKVKTIYTNNGVMAGIEWALPTVVTAYLLKPFFETILKEAAKDLYSAVKLKLKDFISKNRARKYKYITATASVEKLSGNYNQSITVSLEAFLHPKVKVKVLFDESVSDDDMDAMLEGMFEVLKYIYSECQKNIPEEVSETDDDKLDLFLLANLDSQTWEILTQKQMVERYKRK